MPWHSARLDRSACSAHAAQEETMPTGTVKWFDPQKGYGYIQPDNSERDIIVHVAEVNSAGLRRLAERQRLSYEVETGYGSIQAVNLKALDVRRTPPR
jgi:CspA family cold shock protein